MNDEALKQDIELADAAEACVKQLEGEFGTASSCTLSREELEEVRKGNATAFSLSPVQVPRKSLAEACGRLLQVLLEDSDEAIDGETRAALRDLDWEAALPRNAEALAGKAPEELLEQIAESGVPGLSAEATDLYVIPVFTLAIRVFVSRAAREASSLLASLESVEKRFAFSSSCPICGGTPSIARISETVSHGSQRRLVCGTCGGTWLWYRIGCPSCGSRDSKDFEYISCEGDESEALYVCHNCGHILPTLFRKDDIEDDPVTEADTVRLQALEDEYLESKA